MSKFVNLLFFSSQFAVAVEYTDCVAADVLDTRFNECPVYNNKQSDDEYLVMLGV